MGCFVCDKCECIENTALCDYWSRDSENLWSDEYLGKKLCSECGAPNFKSGEPIERKWHGRFPKEHWSEKYDVKPEGLF